MKQPTAAHVNMLTESLRYAQAGFYVVPLHHPIFNTDGTLAGCSCESYKRSPKHQKWCNEHGKKFDPAFQCKTPGKHPKMNGWEAEASTDPSTIRAWFARWPQLNIGIAAGKSGLVDFDHDTYKSGYAGTELFSAADQQTVTQISHRGGEHLIYAMPPGKAYTNANKTLPPGVDIRATGGQFVVYPSIGPSGRMYQWEDGFSLFDMPPAPLPKALEALLDAANRPTAPAVPVTFTATTTAPPDLSKLRISKRIRDMMRNPPPFPERSQADASVCSSLISAGASNDLILAVFEHYAIGRLGKYAEKGRPYLALTIAEAIAWCLENPVADTSATQADVRGTVADVRMWARTHSFAAHVPSSPTGVYRTDGTDHRVADAVFDLMEEDLSLDIVAGKRRLAALAGVGPNTAMRALNRLHGWLFTITPDERGQRVALVENRRFESMDHPTEYESTVIGGGPSTQFDNLTDEYRTRKAADPFLAGTSRYIKMQMRDAAAAMDISYTEALEQLTSKALGESALRLLDALARLGHATAADLADETGKKKATVQAACRRLVQHNLLDAHREGRTGPKEYSLAADWEARLEALQPNLRTYKLSNQRESNRLERAQQWTKTQLRIATAAGDVEQAQTLDRRLARLSTARLPHLEALHPDLDLDAITRLARDVQAYKGRKAPTAPPPPPTPEVTPRWGFVGNLAGLRADLELSLRPGANWQREADWLTKYFDGREDDHTVGQRLAMEMGIFYQYKIAWQEIRSAT